METLLIMIPFMVLAIAIAVVPLLWAMRLQGTRADVSPIAEARSSEQLEPIAA